MHQKKIKTCKHLCVRRKYYKRKKGMQKKKKSFQSINLMYIIYLGRDTYYKGKKVCLVNLTLHIYRKFLISKTFLVLLNFNLITTSRTIINNFKCDATRSGPKLEPITCPATTKIL